MVVIKKGNDGVLRGRPECGPSQVTPPQPCIRYCEFREDNSFERLSICVPFHNECLKSHFWSLK